MKLEQVLKLFAEISHELFKGDQRRIHVWLDLLDAAKKTGHLPEIENCITQVTSALNTEYPEHRNFDGLVQQYVKKDLEQALTIFSTNIQNANTVSTLSYTNSLINRGTLYILQGKYDLAAVDYQSVIALSQNDASLAHNLARAELALKNLAFSKAKVTDDAQTMLENAYLDLDPGAFLQQTTAQQLPFAIYASALQQKKMASRITLLEQASDLGCVEATDELVAVLTNGLKFPAWRDSATLKLGLLFLEGQEYPHIPSAYQFVYAILAADPEVFDTPGARNTVASLAEKDPSVSHKALYEYDRAHQFGSSVATHHIARLLGPNQDTNAALSYYLNASLARMAAGNWRAHPKICELVARYPKAKEQVRDAILAIENAKNQLRALKSAFNPKNSLYAFFATTRGGFFGGSRAQINCGVFKDLLCSKCIAEDTRQTLLAHITNDSVLQTKISASEREWLKAQATPYAEAAKSLSDCGF